MITEVPSVKTDHGFTDWAYRVYNTSVPIDNQGNPHTYLVWVPTAIQELTISKNNTTVGFNVVVSLEWDADANYLQSLQNGFSKASQYLYDVTDGQMLFEQVTIRDNGQSWPYADFHFFANIIQWPEGDVWGWHSLTETIRTGRYWQVNDRVIVWSDDLGARTMVHEFGHYGLGLYDSHYYARSGHKFESACTSESIKTNQV